MLVHQAPQLITQIESNGARIRLCTPRRASGPLAVREPVETPLLNLVVPVKARLDDKAGPGEACHVGGVNTVILPPLPVSHEKARDRRTHRLHARQRHETVYRQPNLAIWSDDGGTKSIERCGVKGCGQAICNLDTAMASADGMRQLTLFP